MNRALFPISVDSPLFRTHRILPALAAIADRFNEIIVLVADELHLYNDVESADNVDALRTALGHPEGVAGEQRERWARRLLAAPTLQGLCLWRVITMSAVSDLIYVRVLRNVRIAYHHIRAFRDDIDREASLHARALPRANVMLSTALSTEYLLEEVALNIRLHVAESIGDEFYAGETLEPLLRIHSGAYGLRPADLAGVSTGPRDESRFHRWNADRELWEQLR